jgi:hypothetical protein
MLRIHGTALRVQELSANKRPAKEISLAVSNYIQEFLNWQKTNGFFGAYGVDKKVVFDNYIYNDDSRIVRESWQKAVQDQQDRKQLESSIAEQFIAQGYKDFVVKAITGQLFGTAHMGEGDENPIFRKLPSQNEIRPWAKPSGN